MFTYKVIGSMSKYLLQHLLTMPLLPPLLILVEGGEVRLTTTNEQDLYRASITFKSSGKKLNNYSGLSGILNYGK
jgi:hypothetical protein